MVIRRKRSLLQDMVRSELKKGPRLLSVLADELDTPSRQIEQVITQLRSNGDHIEFLRTKRGDLIYYLPEFKKEAEFLQKSLGEPIVNKVGKPDSRKGEPVVPEPRRYPRRSAEPRVLNSLYPQKDKVKISPRLNKTLNRFIDKNKHDVLKALKAKGKRYEHAFDIVRMRLMDEDWSRHLALEHVADEIIVRVIVAYFHKEKFHLHTLRVWHVPPYLVDRVVSDLAEFST